MTSIHTNSGTISALQTLRSLSRSMEETQGQISSGLRVATASDNAAYWSISTTMRSDEKALSAVSDALGLGAAIVETAYAATNSSIDLLTEIRSRIVAAHEPGIDRAKLQSEIGELIAGLVSTAKAASFSGENWLSVDVDIGGTAETNRSVVGGFVRSSDNGVAVRILDFDIEATALFNADGGGLLQADIRSPGAIGVLRSGADLMDKGETGYQSFEFDGPLVFGPTDNITFAIEFDADDPAKPWAGPGTVTTAVIDQTSLMNSLGTMTISTPWQMAMAVNYALTLADRSGYVGSSGNTFTINSTTGIVGSSVNLLSVTSTLTGPPNPTGGLDTPYAPVYGKPAEVFFTFAGPFRLFQDVTFSFSLQLDDNPPVTMTVDRAMVDTVLGTTDGWINSIDDMVALLNAALDGKGVVASADNGVVRLNVDEDVSHVVGTNSKIRIFDVTDSVSDRASFNLVDLDITSDAITLDTYLDGIELMLKAATTSAARLGAFQAHIDRQADHVGLLRDTIREGVGRLVDADMNEASTRLRALETQQQLAHQALNIANTDAANIQRLFG